MKSHGHERNRTRTRILRIYRNMVQRCTDPGSTSWKYYGARGIKVLWKSNINFTTLWKRIHSGWAIERALCSTVYNKEK